MAVKEEMHEPDGLAVHLGDQGAELGASEPVPLGPMRVRDDVFHSGNVEEPFRRPDTLELTDRGTAQRESDVTIVLRPRGV